MIISKLKTKNTPLFAWHARGHRFDSGILHQIESLIQQRLQRKTKKNKEEKRGLPLTKSLTLQVISPLFLLTVNSLNSSL